MRSLHLQLLLAISLSATVARTAGQTCFQTVATGDKETTAVTTDTTGQLKLEFDAALTTATYDLDIEDGVNIVAAHLHCGLIGEDGDVIVDLSLNDAGDAADGAVLDGNGSILATECGATISDLHAAMQSGRVYLNVHSVLNPGGEVRGQLVECGTVPASCGTEANGIQEVPPVVTGTEAQLNLKFNKALTEVEFDLDIQDGLQIVQAHLHCGEIGVNGAVIAFLFDAAPQPSVDFDGDANAGTLTNGDLSGIDCGGTTVSTIEGLFAAVLAGNVYLNVHSAANPGGEVRGQFSGCTPVRGGGGMGDPHFNTWNDEWFDYHGICDLVLLAAPGFSTGLGLDVQIRTKPRYGYSYIEAVAIRVGEDVLEVGSYGEYMVNGVRDASLDDVKLGGVYAIEHEEQSEKAHRFTIKTGQEEALIVKTHNDMVNFRVENGGPENFETATGMMGSYSNGSLLARDGATVMKKNQLDRFGQEWQVQADEGELFQLPSPYKHCVLPSNIQQSRRRLGEASVSKEAATIACARFKENRKRDMCVLDVIAMADLEAADVHGAY